MKKPEDIFNILAVIVMIILIVFLVEGLSNKTIIKLPACFSSLFESKSIEK